MEFYLSFHELLGRGGNSVAIIFLPLFFTMIVLEGLVILYRQGTYPWKNAGASVLVTVYGTLSTMRHRNRDDVFAKQKSDLAGWCSGSFKLRVASPPFSPQCRRDGGALVPGLLCL